VVSKEPEEIPDEVHEQMFERVCAVDVVKNAGKVCVRLPAASSAGRRVSRVWDVPARSRAVADLADELVELGVVKVTVESTSDYWRIWFYLLEARGLDVQLVNARDVKNVPGRPKTDKLDAVWLAKLTEKGLLRPSFVPSRPIRVLRDYTRLRTDLTAERARHWQRLEKLLEGALIKVTSVASRIDTLSVRDMVEALIAGERDPHRLADLARAQMRTKRADLVEALTGQFDDHHGELARVLLDQIDTLNRHIDKLSARIDALLADMPVPPGADGAGAAHARAGGHPASAHQASIAGSGTTGAPGSGTRAGPSTEMTARDLVEILDEIPGIGRQVAEVIIAEVGLDMTKWPTAGHMVSWAKLSPRTIQSGARNTSGKTGKGNRYLKAVLGDAAAGAGKTKTFLGDRHRRILRRRGKLKAVVATARSTLVIVYNLLANPGTRYNDLGEDYFNNRIDLGRRTRNHVRQLEALGYEVTLCLPAA
jgi:transposase